MMYVIFGIVYFGVAGLMCKHFYDVGWSKGWSDHIDYAWKSQLEWKELMKNTTMVKLDDLTD